MSTLHQSREPEEPALPPGFDPTRDVLRPARAVAVPPRYEPLGGRAAAATAVFGLLLVLDAVAVGSSLLEVQLLDRIAAGETVSDAQLEANDRRQGMIGIGQFALFVACVVTFIRWLHRAYENMDSIGPPYRRFEGGWAIGAWFVPFLSLWRPKQIVNDVYDSGLRERRRRPFWLHLWWVGFLVSFFVLGRIAFPDLSDNPTLPQLRQDSINYMIADGFDVAVLALAILTIRVLTKGQQHKAETMAAVPRQPLPGTPGATPQPA